MHRSLLVVWALALSFLLSGCALFQTRPAPTKRDAQRVLKEQNEQPRSLDHPGDASRTGDDDDHGEGDDDRND